MGGHPFTGISIGAASPALREKPVELVRKRLSIGVRVRRRSTGLHAAAAQVVHEVSQRERFLDVFLRVQRAARVEHDAAARDDIGGKGYVGGDDEIARLHRRGYRVVRHLLDDGTCPRCGRALAGRVLATGSAGPVPCG